MLNARCLLFVALLAGHAPATALAGTGSVIERSRVSAGDASPGDRYGEVVAMKGTLAVVGAPGSDAAGPTDSGAAYVLEQRGAGWVEVAKLLPSAPVADGQFGSSVAISEDRIVIGTREPAPSWGAAYVFEPSGTSWIEAARLTAWDGAEGDGFGHSVAVLGDTILVGAPMHDTPGADAGAVYVFVRNPWLWGLQTRLRPRGHPVSVVGRRFGTTVALLDDTALISSPGYDPNGSVDLFERTGTTWDEGRTQSYGVVGQSMTTDGVRFAYSGAGYVPIFLRTPEGWSGEGVVQPPDGEQDILFGASVSVSGDRLLVGARNSDAAQADAGAVYAYERDGNRWRFAQELTASDASMGDGLHAVAMDGNRALAGAPGSDAGAGDAGQVYGLGLAEVTPRPRPALFATGARSIAVDRETLMASSRLSCTQRIRTFARTDAPDSPWTLGASFFEGLNANLGESMSVDGDHAVAGSPHASRNGAGWFDHGGCFHPARYLGRVTFYERRAGTWVENGVIEPHYGGRLGYSVDLEGDLAVAGEPDGGVPDLDLLQGRVVLFSRGLDGWEAQGTLTAADGDSRDAFGVSVALHSGTLAVGAPRAGGLGTGAVYVFEQQAEGFVQTDRLSSTGAHPNARLGSVIALDGDLLAVTSGGPSAFPYVTSHPAPASVTVFARLGSRWEQQATILPDGPDPFAAAIDLKGDRLAVTHGESVQVYLQIGDEWILEHTLHVGGDAADVAFLDDRVIVSALELQEFTLPHTELRFCDASDGALDRCPCANVGLPDSGCDTPGGRGGIVLDVLSQSDSAPQRATLMATGFPPGSLASGTLLRSSSLEPGGAVVFGDGLRCLALPVTRVGAGQGTGGAIDFTVRHGPQVGVGTFFYQLHFRSTPAAYCDQAAAFNMSSGRAVTWR